jgi:hypothetical protein
MVEQVMPYSKFAPSLATKSLWERNWGCVDFFRKRFQKPSPKLYRLMESSYKDVAIQMMGLLQIFTCGLYGSWINGLVALDTFNFVFMVLYQLEISLRVYIYGLWKFWYFPEKAIKQTAYRMELLVTTTATLSWIIARVYAGSSGVGVGFGPGQRLRGVFAISLLRCLTNMRSVRFLFCGLMVVLFKFKHIIMACLVLMYVTARSLDTYKEF